MEYLVKIIEVIAWPLTAITLVIYFRNPIIEIIPQLAKFKYKELEMEFKKELKEVSKKSKDSKTGVEDDIPQDKEEEHYLEEIKRISPRAAILEAWLGLESQVLSTTEHFKLFTKNQRPTFSAALKSLEKADVITSDDIELINSLRKLRNMAAHQAEFTITEDEASLFIDAAKNQAEMIIGNSWRYLG